MNYTRTVLTILAAALLTSACGREEAPTPAAAATAPAGSAAPEATPAPGAGAPGGLPPSAGPSGGAPAGTASAASVPPQKSVSAGTGTADKTPAAAKPTAAPAKSSSPVLKWTEFFDDEKQATPSDKFWDLNGKNVEIRGFMGEVLSFDKHWFLLIPAPGAECPFDNGDETYWNKIMIVFVPKETKLRYTSGPLKIKGRLDVGIKVDESGYKTMFRLYDASFEPIKE